MRSIPTVDGRASLVTGLVSIAVLVAAIGVLALVEETADRETGVTASLPGSGAGKVPGNNPMGVDFVRIRDVQKRKRLFVEALLPVIRRENARIRRERSLAEGDPPDWLYRKYRVTPGDRETLIRRIDVVPPSLALAQAAVESGWGTSRFLHEANNLYGERTYSRNAEGITPREASGFKVTAFPSVTHSVRSYLHNLNSHAAYRSFREERERLRKDSVLSGFELARYLEAYSEKRDEYVQILQRVIRDNDLHEFDHARVALR